MSKTLLNIEVIAPCSPFDPHRLQRGIDALKARGHQVQAPSLPTDWAHGYLNGDAAFRANAIINGLKNPNNDVVWIARGGYGLTPLLPKLLNISIQFQNSSVFLMSPHCIASCSHNVITSVFMAP
jgi:muramoyltetrapeptide carboxypeptidase LdcA involved in peptidoglycan recycling